MAAGVATQENTPRLTPKEDRPGWSIPPRMPMERPSWVIKSISGPRQWGPG